METFFALAEAAFLLRSPYFFLFPFRTAPGVLLNPKLRAMPVFRLRSLFILNKGWQDWYDVVIGKALLTEALRRQMNTYAFGTKVPASRLAARAGLRSITVQAPALYGDLALTIEQPSGIVRGRPRAATLDAKGELRPFAQVLPDNNFAIFDFVVQRAIRTPTDEEYAQTSRGLPPPPASTEHDQVTAGHHGLTDGEIGGLVAGVVLLLTVLVLVLRKTTRGSRLFASQLPHSFGSELAALPLTSRAFEAPLELSDAMVRNERLLAKGSASVVTAGLLRQPRGKPDVLVAIKRTDTLTYPELRTHVLREMAVLAQFRRQPHIVHLEGVLTKSSILGIVMELCPGGSLADYLQTRSKHGKTASWTSRVKMAGDVAQGMAVVHNSNILHLNLAARHVLVAHDGNCKIADFGAIGMPGWDLGR